MTLVKSFLLASAASLVAVAGANAADLPARKAAAVEYVRVCNTYGAGFFYIPGTETCLRIGGRVRADYLFDTPFARSSDALGFRARGRIQLDARTATAYGLVRSFVRFEITRSSGTPFGGTGVVRPQSADVESAFVQFGGLTAGRLDSFFSNTDLPSENMGTLRFDDAPNVDVLAYTFTFGNGFSATLAIEDGIERRQSGFIAGGPASSALNYAGERAPDVVGNLKYTGTWGTAQLSGALHQIRSNNLVSLPTQFGAVANYPDTEYGFAIAASIGVNLPQIAPGDALWVSATYADGAVGYLNGGTVGSNGTIAGPSTELGAGNILLTDGFINANTGNIERTKAWAVAGGFRHYWTPRIRSNLLGSYMRVNYGAAAGGIDATGFGFGLVDFNEYRIGGNVIWQPVSGLDLGLEVIYARVDPRGRVSTGPFTSIGSSDAVEGRLRIQRDF
ncbi:porin [Microvirga terricola]|uniref:Porin n=1 Tax=Microvirga terricola TaxID=2719797 RepID=A0ABX0V7R7_9HYPH|nr:porin [Microvirga terricola]NIX75895.1 porin [Microvirga terricola]